MKTFLIPAVKMPMSVVAHTGHVMTGFEIVPTVDYLGRRLTPGLIKDCWELNEYQFTRQLLDDTHIVIDLGANIGAAAFCAALIGPDVRVLAVEADKLNYGCLCKNIIENKMVGQIFPVHCAAHAETGWVYVTTNMTASHVVMNVPSPAELNSGIFGVPSRSLKAIFDDFEIDRCDVLKVDIEGSEFAMFARADPATIARARHIVMEVHGTGKDDTSIPLVDALLNKLSQSHAVDWLGHKVHGGWLRANRK